MTTTELVQIEKLPPQLFEVEANTLYKVFPQPTLLHLAGKNPNPLFISVLQHGNEPTGFKAIQSILKKYQHKELPRALSIFFGNTQAARVGKRLLENGIDYNRVWPGTEHPVPETELVMQKIIDEMVQRNVFASIDVHNNSGLNPHYGCINKLENPFLQLAHHFSPIMVYFLTPKGVQSQAFCEYCPAITVECGQPDSFNGVPHATKYIEDVMSMDAIPTEENFAAGTKLLHTVARVRISDPLSFSFLSDDTEVQLDKDLEHMNFLDIPAGTVFGATNSAADIPPFEVTNEQEADVFDQYFIVQDKQIKTRKPFIPAMITLNEEIVRQDCLCYLMEHYDQEKFSLFNK